MFGVHLVSKLCAILLMEADFNAMNEEVNGVRMLDKVQKFKLIPEEIFSEKNCMADDGGLAKCFSAISSVRHAQRWPLHWLTHPTVTTGLHMQWHL
jgi:hypothetical protein